MVAAEVECRRVAYPHAEVLAVVADAGSRAAFGSDVLDPSSMPASAEAGHRQGRALASEVERIWAG